MLSRQTFINQSLELNLFFLRIMKEHFIFLEASLFPKNKELINAASLFKNEFTKLLKYTLPLSQNIVVPKAENTNEFVTKYTLGAEELTQYATGIPIDTSMTLTESTTLMRDDISDMDFIKDLNIDLEGDLFNMTSLEEHVRKFNQYILKTVDMSIDFQTRLVEDFLSCKLFTHMYPSMLEHILEEAIYYAELLETLQKDESIDIKKHLMDEEYFWSHIMSEHAFFIRGLLDPSEGVLIETANKLGSDFEALMEEASPNKALSQNIPNLTARTLQAATTLRDFKIRVTEGLLTCQIKSTLLPLLADHLLREANHYINILSSLNSI